jgi:hypothetical protein
VSDLRFSFKKDFRDIEKAARENLQKQDKTRMAVW